MNKLIESLDWQPPKTIPVAKNVLIKVDDDTFFTGQVYIEFNQKTIVPNIGMRCDNWLTLDDIVAWCEIEEN